MFIINFLNIAFWNANGLAQHTLEVKYFLNEKQIDILLISETHFTAKNYFTIPNFKFYHANHPDGTSHGGSAILITSNTKRGNIFALKKYRPLML